MADDVTAVAVEVLKLEVAKLDLKPGDVLLVRVPKSMEESGVWRRLNDHLGRTFPDSKVLLATHDIEFSVIQPQA